MNNYCGPSCSTIYCFGPFNITHLSTACIIQVLDADLPPYDTYRITMISGDEEYFQMIDDHIDVLKPLDVPPGILLSEYTIGKVHIGSS